MAAFSELTLYSVTSVAALAAMCQVLYCTVLLYCSVLYCTVQMRRLDYDTHATLELDNLLLLIAQTGVFIYAAFSIIGTFFQVSLLVTYGRFAFEYLK